MRGQSTAYSRTAWMLFAYAFLFASPQGLWDLSCWGSLPCPPNGSRQHRMLGLPWS